ncbi:hypothetical protein MRX96_030918 [Rhipicephalus microplus]
MHRSTLSSRAGPSSHKESACQRRTGFHSRGIFAPPLTPRRLPGGSPPWDAPPRTRPAALCPSRGAHLLRADAPGAIGAGIAPWDDLDVEDASACRHARAVVNGEHTTREALSCPG